MGIIDIPGERFNLAGKEATFSPSYLCVILGMTIATSRGGTRDTGRERCRWTPADGGVGGEPPAPHVPPACPRWPLGRLGHPGTAAGGPCIAQTPAPSHSAASQPHPSLPERWVVGVLLPAVPTEGGRSFSSRCVPQAVFSRRRAGLQTALSWSVSQERTLAGAELPPHA